MRIYHRDPVELALIERSRHEGDLLAKEIVKKLFQGTPGTLVAIEVLNKGLYGIIFLARATHPDEPIPFFKNLNSEESVLFRKTTGHIACVPGPDAIPISTFSNFPLYSSRPSFVRDIIDKAVEKDATQIFIFPKSGLICANNQRLISKMQCQSMSQELHEIYQGEWQSE